MKMAVGCRAILIPSFAALALVCGCKSNSVDVTASAEVRQLSVVGLELCVDDPIDLKSGGAIDTLRCVDAFSFAEPDFKVTTRLMPGMTLVTTRVLRLRETTKDEIVDTYQVVLAKVVDGPLSGREIAIGRTRLDVSGRLVVEWCRGIAPCTQRL